MKRQLLTSAKTDREVINLWLGRKSRTTQISYRAIIRQFLEFVDKPLVDVTLDDLELWLRRLRLTYKPATIQNKILVVKSLFSFCVEVDYLEVNVSRWTTFYSQGKIIYFNEPKLSDRLFDFLNSVNSLASVIPHGINEST